jgi:trimethylamine--corrinoid protein Co-methyltransferase
MPVDCRLTCLSSAERDLVIESALTILDRVGMRMAGARALSALEHVGAVVDWDTSIVRMPEEVVRAAVDKLPEKLLMAGATPAQDVVLDRRGGPFFNPAGCMAKTLDFRTGSVRPSNLQDLREGTVVMDATPELDVMWTFVTADDVPIERRELIEYHTYLTNTAKPLVCVDCPTEVEAVKRIMDILGDGLDGYRRRPRLSLLCAARAPLEVNGHLLNAACDFASLGTPIWTFTMPIAGATGPVTVAGTLALMWAETLGLVTAIQAAAPGAAILACCGPGILDMRTSSMSLGCLENTLMGLASIEIGHHLGLPVHNSGLATDAKYPGLQAGYEKGLKALPAALAGADIISAGFGALDTSGLFHLPMVPIDAEMAAMVRRLSAGAEITKESVMLDAIERLGVGGNYLKERITRDRIRAGEHFVPAIGSRLPYEQWAAEGRMEADVAREKVEEILAARKAQGSAEGMAFLDTDQMAALADVCGVAG